MATLIKLESVGFFNDDYMVERLEQGETVEISEQGGSAHMHFPADDWPQIQDLVNVAMAAYPAMKVFEQLQEDER